jgi:hypothetical protein
MERIRIHYQQQYLLAAKDTRPFDYETLIHAHPPPDLRQ